MSAFDPLQTLVISGLRWDKTLFDIGLVAWGKDLQLSIARTTIFFVWLSSTATAGVTQNPAARAASTAVPISRAAFLTTMEVEFRKMDADRNGTVTRLEVQAYERAAAMRMIEARRRALFGALDSDRNGTISQVEFAALPIEPPQAAQSAILAQTDLNGDGSIGLVEYRTAKLANFDRTDADKDGVVSVAEMKAVGVAR